MKIEKIEKKKFGSRVARPHKSNQSKDLLGHELLHGVVAEGERLPACDRMSQNTLHRCTSAPAGTCDLSTSSRRQLCR